MAKSIQDRGLLTPRELATLQRVFDGACEAHRVMPDSTEAGEIALTLLALHNAGMQDEGELHAAVGFRRGVPKTN